MAPRHGQDHGQPQSATGQRARVVQPDKAFHHPIPVIGRDPGPVIQHRDFGPSRHCRGAQRDAARAIFQRVVDQVGDRARHQFAVGRGHGRLKPGFQQHARLFGQRFVQFGHVLRHSGQIERHAPVGHRAALQPGDFQRGFEHPAQPVGVFAGRLQRLDRAGFVDPFERGIDRGRQSCHRRSQIVRERSRNCPQFRHQRVDPFGHAVHLQPQMVKAVAAARLGQARAEIARCQLFGGHRNGTRAAADLKPQQQRAGQRQCHRDDDGQAARGRKGQVETAFGGTHHPHHQAFAIGQLSGNGHALDIGNIGSQVHHHRAGALGNVECGNTRQIAEQRGAAAGQRDEHGRIGGAALLAHDHLRQRRPPALQICRQKIVAHVKHLAHAIGAHDFKHLPAQEKDRRRAGQQLQYKHGRDQPQHGRRQASQSAVHRAGVSLRPADSRRRARCGTASCLRHRRSCGANG